MRKNIVVGLLFWLWLSGVAGASTISGVVVNANTNFPVPWAYAQIHWYNPESGYLEFITNGSTAGDGSFFFEAGKEGYSVCGWLQVITPGNPFVVYDRSYLCTPPKGAPLPTSPPVPVPPKG